MPIGTKFGVGYLIGVATTDQTGAALAVPQPFEFGILQDISTDFSFEGKSVHGSGQFAADIGRGKAKLSFSAKTAKIDFDAFAALHFGIPLATGYKGPVIREAFVGAATVTVVPPSGGTFIGDMGISDTTGNRFTRVATVTGAGQYSVTGAGVYTFNSADVGRALLRSYEYSVVGTGTTLNLTQTLMGYSPEFSVILFDDSKGSKQSIKLNRCISEKLSLPMKNEDFTIADFSWEATADASGSVGYISRM